MKDNNSVVKAVFYALAVSLLVQGKCGESVWIANKWCLPVSMFLFYSSYLLDEIYYRQTGVWYEMAEYLAWISFILSGWMQSANQTNFRTYSIYTLCVGIVFVTAGLFLGDGNNRSKKTWRWVWICENVILVGMLFAVCRGMCMGWCSLFFSIIILCEKFYHRFREVKVAAEDVNPDVKRIVDATCTTFYLKLEELRKLAAQQVAENLLTKPDDASKKSSVK